MNPMEDYKRRRLAEIATTATVILGIIADAEERLNKLKSEVKNIYEKTDDLLNGGQNETSEPK